MGPRARFTLILTLLAAPAVAKDENDPCAGPQGFPRIAQMLLSPKRWQFLFDQEQLGLLRVHASGLGRGQPAGLKRVGHVDEFDGAQNGFISLIGNTGQPIYYKIVDTSQGKFVIDYETGGRMPYEGFKHFARDRMSGPSFAYYVLPTKQDQAWTSRILGAAAESDPRMIPLRSVTELAKSPLSKFVEIQPDGRRTIFTFDPAVPSGRFQGGFATGGDPGSAPTLSLEEMQRALATGGGRENRRFYTLKPFPPPENSMAHYTVSRPTLSPDTFTRADIAESIAQHEFRDVEGTKAFVPSAVLGLGKNPYGYHEVVMGKYNPFINTISVTAFDADRNAFVHYPEGFPVERFSRSLQPLAVPLEPKPAP